MNQLSESFMLLIKHKVTYWCDLQKVSLKVGLVVN